MKKSPCEYCNGTAIECIDFHIFESKVIGKVTVPDIKQTKCHQCGSVLLSAESADVIINYVRRKESQAVSNLPIKDFITPGQAIEILGYTKQNFSKNPRIKKGMILSAIIDGKKYYLKKSVELFKDNNDGRFLIQSVNNNPVTVKYIVITTEAPADYKSPYTPDSYIPDHLPWIPQDSYTGVINKYMTTH